MKAIVLRSQGPAARARFERVELPDPEPRPGEVALRILACGVCRTDLHIVEGDLPLRCAPAIPGHQIVGVVEAAGDGVDPAWLGRRAGLGWLRSTCGRCRACRRGAENLCPEATYHGWTHPGGFAERITAPLDFVYEVPAELEAVRAAPLLCAGLIGYRALRFCAEEPAAWSGLRLGLYGFGAAGHLALQLARARGAAVHVRTRGPSRQALALDLGAATAEAPAAPPPEPLDAAVIFAPAGELVPVALRALAPGGRLVLAGIHMSDCPPLPYELLYEERSIQSVKNNTRADGRAFLAEAARIGLATEVEVFPLERAPEALAALAAGRLRGAAAVLEIAPS